MKIANHIQNMFAMDQHYTIWKLVASHVFDPDDLCSMRLVESSAHMAIKKPASKSAQAMRRLFCANKRYSYAVTFYNAHQQSVQLRFEQDNRDCKMRKVSIWFDLKMLGVHRYKDDAAQYFEKKKWADIVAKPHYLKVINRILEDVAIVTIGEFDYAHQIQVENWQTTEWDEYQYFQRPFYW